MSGSQMTSRNRALAALGKADSSRDFVWDGKDEDERPLTASEMRIGIAEAKKRGRPAGSFKVSTTIRFDADILDSFRSKGPGWQSRINKALREWLMSHP